MSLKATNENLPPNVLRQLAKELKNLDESPPEGIKVTVNDDDFTNIFADIEGPGKILSRYVGLYFPLFLGFAVINYILMLIMLWYVLNGFFFVILYLTNYLFRVKY